MKKIKPIYFIAGLLVVLYIMAQYYKPAKIDWTSSLFIDEKKPYDTYIIYHRIRDLFPGAKVSTSRESMYNTVLTRKSNKVNYIIICNTTNVDKNDYNRLTQFIMWGNDVFIASNSLGYMEKKLGLRPNFTYNLQKPPKVSFLHPDISKEQFLFDREVTNGYYDIVSESYEVLGRNEKGQPNFVRIRFGKGFLYLNANPLLFTNYTLLEDGGGRYASLALSHLDPAKELIWDEYYTKGRGGSESELRLFLSHPSLRWSVYIGFFSLLIFVLYQSKRRQASIPVISRPANTSVEFATVVGQVYYEQRDNSNIAQKKVTYFLEHIRTKYHLRTNVLNDEFVSHLAHKTGVENKLIQELCHQIILIRNGHEVTDPGLMKLNQIMEKFYLQTR